MVGVAPGTATAVHFNTPVNLGILRFGVGSKKVLGIQGAVIFDGGVNGSSISVIDSLDTIGRTAHLTQNTLGAFPGDDLFPPGGSLTFTNIKAGSNPGLSLALGSGADTVYAQPSATGTISISGLNPTTAPGDNFRLSLAGVTNPVFTPGGAGAGTYSFTGAQPVSYTGFESHVAAYPGDFDLDGTVGQADYALWTAAFGMNVVPGSSGDANWNGIVDAADYVVWRKNLGASIPGAGVGSGAMASTSKPTARASQPPALPGVRAAESSTIVSARAKPPAEPGAVGWPAMSAHVGGLRHAGSRQDAAAILSIAARHDDALLAWLAARPGDGLAPVFDDELRLCDESFADSDAAPYESVDAVFEELAAVSL
jgi:hypothetical protein